MTKIEKNSSLEEIKEKLNSLYEKGDFFTLSNLIKEYERREISEEIKKLLSEYKEKIKPDYAFLVITIVTFLVISFIVYYYIIR